MDLDLPQIAVDLPLLSRFLASLFCGAIIGLERQIRGKPVGIRTSILICMSTMAFTRLGLIFDGRGGDGTRVLGQIVTGVGFLGAGVIMTRNGAVEGVTSASAVWLLAAVGSAIAFGQLKFGVLLCVIAVTVLIGVEWLERAFLWLRQGVHAHDSKDPGDQSRFFRP